ncbi:MAG: hypothetical protein BroJett003_20280 [Planctomycetota bacterium]|nr:MAG: hypothetical protein BroJett003_20280 [Planctomycetota bacterium]
MKAMMWVAAGVFCLFISVGFAQQKGNPESGLRLPEPSVISMGQKISPLRAVLADENRQPIGPWVDLTGNGVAEDCGAALCFDNVETNGRDVNESQPGDGYYGLDCGLGSGRWFFGPGFCDTYWIDDAAMTETCDGQDIGRIQHAFWWDAAGPGSSEQAMLYIGLYEDFNECSGVDGFLGAFLFDFGPLPSSQDSGRYYYFDIHTCGLFGTIPAPVDGHGAYEGAYVTADGGEFATCAQPMLWSTDKPLNYSEQTGLKFADINPRDGAIVFGNECFDYGAAACPGVLGTATAMWHKGSPNATPKLRAKCNNGSIIARIRDAAPGQLMILELDGFRTRTKPVKANGRCKVRFDFVPAGPHTTRELENELMRNVPCE